MGDPRGFLKVRTRRELAERPVEERIKDWFDVHAESGLQSWTTEQAARCMDCGTPFCSWRTYSAFRSLSEMASSKPVP